MFCYSFDFYRVSYFIPSAHHTQPGTPISVRIPVEAGQKFLVCRKLRYSQKSIV